MDSHSHLLHRVLLVVAVLAALATVSTWFALPGRADHDLVLELGLDADTSGNSANAIGVRDECVSVASGQEFEVDLVVKDVPAPIHGPGGISSLNGALLYDPSRISVLDIDGGYILGAAGGSVADISDATPDSDGEFVISLADFGGPAEHGDGVLARLTLKAEGTGSTELVLGNTPRSEEPPSLTDEQFVPLFPQFVHDATVKIGMACPPAPPTPTPSPPSHGFVSGRVTNYSGEPVTGAEVSFEPSGHGARTAPDGTYHLELPTGSFTVFVNASGYVPVCWTSHGSSRSCATPEAVTIVGGETLEGIDLVIGRYTRVSGHVTDNFGTPIFGARVEVEDSWDETDADGRYSVFPDDGEQAVWVFAPGHVSEYWTSSGGTTDEELAERLYVENGTDQVYENIDFSLSRLGSITGRITDQTGESLTGAWVSLLTETGCTYCQLTTTTDEEGRYYIEGVTPGTYYLNARTEGLLAEYWSASGNAFEGADADSFQVSPDTQAIELDISLSFPARISGQLTSASGDYLHNGSVRAIPLFDCSGCEPFDLPDNSGSYTIEWLRPGKYRLLANITPYFPEFWTIGGGSMDDSQVITVGEGAQLTGFDFNLSKGGHVQGTVTNSGGGAIPGATVTLVDGWCEYPCNFASGTDQNGRYLKRAPAGSQRLEAWARGYYSEYWTADAGTRDPAHAGRVSVIENELSQADFQLEPHNCPNDLSGDGAVSPEDILFVAKSLVKMPRYDPRGDVNGDYVTDISDLRAALDIAVSGACGQG